MLKTREKSKVVVELSFSLLFVVFRCWVTGSYILYVVYLVCWEQSKYYSNWFFLFVWDTCERLRGPENVKLAMPWQRYFEGKKCNKFFVFLWIKRSSGPIIFRFLISHTWIYLSRNDKKTCFFILVSLNRSSGVYPIYYQTNISTVKTETKSKRDNGNRTRVNKGEKPAKTLTLLNLSTHVGVVSFSTSNYQNVSKMKIMRKKHRFGLQMDNCPLV